MTLVAAYTAETLAGYRSLIIGDPYSDADEPDAPQARAAARASGVAGTRYHVHLQTVQSAARVRINLRLWDSPPEPDETGHTLEIECAGGELQIDNVSAGRIDLQTADGGRPAGDQVDLPSGPGRYAVRVAMHGRDDIDALLVEAYSVDTADEQTRRLRALAGHERYEIDVWHI